MPDLIYHACCILGIWILHQLMSEFNNKASIQYVIGRPTVTVGSYGYFHTVMFVYPSTLFKIKRIITALGVWIIDDSCRSRFAFC